MECNQVREDPNEEAALKGKIEKMGKVFVVLSGKGGVGKSTVAVNLALSLAMKGLRTGILDVDLHGPSVPKLVGLSGRKAGFNKDEQVVPLEAKNGLKVMSIGFFIDGNEVPVIWRGPVKAKMIRELVEGVAWGELDSLVVDCPPGTGDEPLSAAKLFAGTGSAVIVTTPQEIATIDVEKCITFCGQVGLSIAGIVENMSGFVCPHCGKDVEIFSSGGGKRLAERFHVPFLGSIPLDPDIVKSGDGGEPYLSSYPGTATARIFGEIVEKIFAGEKQA